MVNGQAITSMTTSMMSPQNEGPTRLIRAYLVIWGDRCDPEQITRKTGLNPTETWRVGDVRHARTGRVHADAGWRIDAEGELGVDVGTYIEHLLDRVWPVREDFQALAATCNVQFSVVLHCRDETPAVHLAGDTVRRMAALGAALDIDLYC